MGYIIFAIALLATAVVYSCAAMSGRCSRNEEADRKRTTDNRCVCCGAEIPEGTWVCINCQGRVEDEEDGRIETMLLDGINFQDLTLI